MRYYINNIEITDQPDGEVITSIKHDEQKGSFLIESDARLNWHGDGYDAIQAVIESDGFCGELDCEIWDDCTGTNTKIYNGKLFILQIKKDDNCVITLPLQDNSFTARINKNKSITINIDSVKSKNGVSIDAAKENSITALDPETNFPAVGKRTGWRVYDVLRHMVSFMSDDEVDFASDYFGLNGDFAGLSVMYGQEMRVAGTGEAISETFDNFFKDLRKLTRCAFYIDSSSITPVFRVEYQEDLFESAIQYTMEGVNGVIYNIDTKKLIARIDIGSDKLVDVLPSSGGVSFVEDSVYITYKKEEYTTLEQCNIDSTLDLSTEYVISSNAIEDQLMNVSDVYNDDITYVDTDTITDNTTNYLSVSIDGRPYNQTVPPYFFNESLMNHNVLDRWKAVLPNSIIDYQGTLNNQFRAA